MFVKLSSSFAKHPNCTAEIKPKGMSVLAGTQAELKCVVTGIDHEMNETVWEGEGASIKSGENGKINFIIILEFLLEIHKTCCFNIVHELICPCPTGYIIANRYNASRGREFAILVIEKAERDAEYTCMFNLDGAWTPSVTVLLDVYGKSCC